jgi:outer membrane receptor protein involved in Fe transport
MTTYFMNWRRLGIAALAAIGMTFCLPAAAQSDEDEGEAAEDDEMIEEIVVTATYRDTMLMDTPLSISAITDVEIELRGVEDIQSLYLSIPGLNYGVATQTYHRVNARGIDSLAWGDTGAVSTYVDNLPIAGYDGYRAPLAPNFDLERIEVLRGPQGTLYGEGSVAGTIRYITKKPNVEGFDWALSARIENPSHSDDTGHRIDAMINIPLGERVAARITPYSRNKPGILDKYGPRIIPDVDFRDEFGFRAQLSWYASDRVTVNFTRHFVDSMHGAPGTAHHCYVDGRPAEGNLAPGDFVAQIPRFPVTAGLAAGADWIDRETNCERGQNGALDGETARFKAGPEHFYVTHMASPQWNDGGWSKTWINNLSIEWELDFADLTWSSGIYEHHIAHSEEQRVGGRFGTLTPDRLPEDKFHAWLSQPANHKLIRTGEGGRSSRFDECETGPLTLDQRIKCDWYGYTDWHWRLIEVCKEAIPEFDCDSGVFWGRSSSRAGLNLYDRMTHEVRLVSNQPENRLQWAVGAYLETNEDGDDPRSWSYCGAVGHQNRSIFGGAAYPDITCQNSRSAGITYNPALTLDQIRTMHRLLQTTSAGRPGAASYHQREESAIFGEVSYAISDQLEILAGARFARSEFSTFAGPSGRWSTFDEMTQRAETQTQEKAAPKVTLTWRPNDSTMVYAMLANAFRAGGVNTRLVSRLVEYEELAARGVPGAQENLNAALDLLTFEGDDVTSLELGVKATVLDGRLDFTLAAYQMDIQNAVVTTSFVFRELVDPASPVGGAPPYPTSVSSNIGEAKSRGFEFEARGQLTDALSLRAGGAWIPDAETLAQEAGGTIAGAGVAINIKPGNRIRLTPVLAYFASLQYDFQIAGYDGSLRGDYYYRGKKVFRTENNERQTPTYGFLNAKLMFARDNYELGIYVNNVMDEIAPYSLGDSGYHGFHPPRSIGFEYRMNR